MTGLRTLSVGEILDAAFTVFRKHFAALAAIVLVCSLVPLALDTYLSASGGKMANLPLALVYLVVAVVLNAIATGATVFIVAEHYLGRTITAGAAFQRAMPQMGAVIMCSLLMGVVVLFGFVVFIIPGFIALCGLIVAIPAVVLEPGLAPSAALSRSWALTQGHRWRIFGIFVVALVLVYLPTVAVYGVVELLVPSASGEGPMASNTAEIAASLAMIFLSPLIYCVLTVTYYDLRVRKEGFDLELLASSLQPA